MPPIPCLPGVSGRCRICELIDRTHPDYSEGHRRQFHPEEFPAVLAPAGPVTAPAAGRAAVPGLLQKAASFAKAVGQHVAAGLPVAGEETVLARLQLCHGCEHFNAPQSTCGLCGCLCDTKARWATQHCPIGKW